MIDRADRAPEENRENSPLFELGELLMTPGVQANTSHEERMAAIRRHMTGDWGDVPREDAAQNESAIQSHGRILSSYRSSTRVKFWIITEADRSATTLLLPEEY